MKVLMIAPQPFFEPRGTPISIYQRLRGLSSMGYKVDLVTYPIGSNPEIAGVTIYRTPSVPFINNVKIGPSFAKIPLDIMLFFMTFWMLLTRRYDVVHSHEEAAFFAFFLSKLFRTPHLYDMHSSLPKQLTNFNFGNYRPIVNLFGVLENWVLRTCDVVLTIGSDLEDHVLHVNKKANHIRIENIAVHNGLSSDDQAVADLRQSLDLAGKTTIVYTGTFETYQGLDVLFAGAKEVAAAHPEVRFVMVGGKPEQVASWKQEVDQMGIGSNVIFTGTVSLHESLNYIELADILVSPRTEGLSVPLKIYSYMYSGKPIVATGIFAHTQILNEETAVLTSTDPHAYANGIRRLIEAPELRLQIGEAARAYAEKHYSAKSYLAKLEKAFMSIQLKKSITELSVPESVGGDKVLVG